MNVLARWAILGSVLPLAGCLSVASQVGVGLVTAAEQQVYNNVTDQKQQKELAWRQAMAKPNCADIQSAYVKNRDANLLTANSERRDVLLQILRQKKCRVPA